MDSYTVRGGQRSLTPSATEQKTSEQRTEPVQAIIAKPKSKEFSFYQNQFKALAGRRIINTDLNQEEKLMLYKWVQVAQDDTLRKHRSTAVVWMDEGFENQEIDNSLNLQELCQVDIPFFIERMTWLSFLNLRSCSLLYFPVALCSLTNLIELNLIDNLLRRLPDDVIHLTEAIIYLKGNPIDKNWKFNEARKINSREKTPSLDFDREPKNDSPSQSEEESPPSSTKKEVKMAVPYSETYESPFLGVASTSEEHFATFEDCVACLEDFVNGQQLNEDLKNQLRLRQPNMLGRIVNFIDYHRSLLISANFTPTPNFNMALLTLIYKLAKLDPIFDSAYLHPILERKKSASELITNIETIENSLTMTCILQEGFGVLQFIHMKQIEKRLEKLKQLTKASTKGKSKSGKEKSNLDLLSKFHFYKYLFGELFQLPKNTTDHLFTEFPQQLQSEHDYILNELTETRVAINDIFNLDEWVRCLSSYLKRSNQDLDKNDEEKIYLKTEERLSEYHMLYSAQHVYLPEQEPPSKRPRLL